LPASESVLNWTLDQWLPEGRRAAVTGPGAPFEMAEEELLGTKMAVFSRRPATVRQALEAATQRLGDHPFLIFPERTLTYRSIHSSIAAIAASLSERFGVAPGDRVAIASANIYQHAITAWAAVSVGAIVVELNGWWTGSELVHGIELTGPKVVLGDRKRLDRLPQGPFGVPLVCFEDDFAGLEAGGEGRPLPSDPVGEDDPLCILFTSGTTGRPKGAVLSHRAHIHAMMQSALQGQIGALLESASTGQSPAVQPGCSIGVSPMFHVSGFSYALIGGALIGSTIAYPPPGRWDPEVHLELTERYGATAWSVVPTQAWRLIEHPRLGEFDLSSLRRIGGGGATFPPELWKQVRSTLPEVVHMGTGYGMTETCGAGTHQGGRAAEEHPDAVGAVAPGYSISIRDAEGSPVPEGETGEIFLRGPCNFLGYWDDSVATRAALDDDRWYRTSELGHVSDGLLYLDGRSVDLIIRGGENIYPIEIENRLVEHPDITEAAVIGVPDRVRGWDRDSPRSRSPRKWSSDRICPTTPPARSSSPCCDNPRRSPCSRGNRCRPIAWRSRT
jgi:acyl-CoA synthetase (AMP-forming)/AMP-acid ligase II